MGVKRARFRLMLAGAWAYLVGWQVWAAAESPSAQPLAGSKPPATYSEGAWALYVLCAVLAVALAYVCVAWRNKP